MPDWPFPTSNLESICEQVKTRLVPFCSSLPRNRGKTQLWQGLSLGYSFIDMAATSWRAQKTLGSKATSSVSLGRGFAPQQSLPALTLRALTDTKECPTKVGTKATVPIIPTGPSQVPVSHTRYGQPCSTKIAKPELMLGSVWADPVALTLIPVLSFSKCVHADNPVQVPKPVEVKQRILSYTRC